MKCSVVRSSSPLVNERLQAVEEGLRRNAVEVEVFVDRFDVGGDFAVTWGLNRARRVWAAGFRGPILIVEHGYIGDRWQWISLGWNGLNGRAIFPTAWDATRFERHFMMAPWRERDGKTAVLMGQVRGDQSLIGVDIFDWYAKAALELNSKGWLVYFRQHPVELNRGFDPFLVEGTIPHEGSMQDAMARADLVVTYNSNTGVDAMIHGVPAHTQDRGSMVFGITSHNFEPIRPDRQRRMNEIACVQWSLGEIRSGFAWEIVRETMPAGIEA